MKNNLIMAAVVSLIIGFSGGYLLADSKKDETKQSGEMSHSDEAHTMDEHSGDSLMLHSHNMFNVEVGQAPSVSFTAEEDAKSGWNITLKTDKFKFTPENVNGENVVGEGHAHLYVGGEKVARLYGPNFHYDEAFDGTKTFRVTLNANNHEEYAVDGDVIDAQQQISHKHHN